MVKWCGSPVRTYQPAWSRLNGVRLVGGKVKKICMKKTNGVASVVTSHEEREHSQFRSQLTYHAPRPMIISIFPLLIGVHSFDHTQPKKLLFGVTMTTLRQFCLDDCLRFNNINLDVLTETYNGKSNRTWEAIDGPPMDHRFMSHHHHLSRCHMHTHTHTNRRLLHELPGQVAGILYCGGITQSTTHGLCLGQGGRRRQTLARACIGCDCGTEVSVVKYIEYFAYPT